VSSIIETDIEIQTENLSYKKGRFTRSAWISQIKQPTDSAEEQTLWFGLQRYYDLSNAWNAFGPGSKKNSSA